MWTELKTNPLTIIHTTFQMQTLPAPLSVVEGTPILMGDNVATVLLQAWKLTTEAFGTRELKCPVPTLFAEDAVTTTERVDANSVNIRDGLVQLAQR